MRAPGADAALPSPWPWAAAVHVQLVETHHLSLTSSGLLCQQHCLGPGGILPSGLSSSPPASPPRLSSAQALVETRAASGAEMCRGEVTDGFFRVEDQGSLKTLEMLRSRVPPSTGRKGLQPRAPACVCHISSYRHDLICSTCPKAAFLPLPLSFSFPLFFSPSPPSPLVPVWSWEDTDLFGRVWCMA